MLHNLVCFCDGGCYTTTEYTTPAYFSVMIWKEQTLQNFYNGKNVNPLLHIGKFFLLNIPAYTTLNGSNFNLPADCSIFNHKNLQTNNIAEFCALYYTLSIVHSDFIDYNNIEIMSDSQLAVNIVNNKWKCKTEHLIPWKRAIDEKLNLLHNVTIKWVSRKIIENMLGH